MRTMRASVAMAQRRSEAGWGEGGWRTCSPESSPQWGSLASFHCSCEKPIVPFRWAHLKILFLAWPLLQRRSKGSLAAIWCVGSLLLMGVLLGADGELEMGHGSVWSASVAGCALLKPFPARREGLW